MRLVGDDCQLAAVGGGGLLRDIARTHGPVTVTEVRRFARPDGGPNRAEAAIRAGSMSATKPARLTRPSPRGPQTGTTVWIPC